MRVTAPADSATTMARPSPGAPVTSSEVTARISAMDEAMRRPVAMQGAVLGSVTWRKRASAGGP
jgi:hypothetical protein